MVQARADASGERRGGRAPEAPSERRTSAATGSPWPPPPRPRRSRSIIEAGNAIATKPYKYGGGHGRWSDSGYDCSGSVSYVLHAAGLLNRALDSSGFMSWGERGRGTWVTIRSNPGHAYMIVAGLRFDTSARSRTATAGASRCALRAASAGATPKDCEKHGCAAGSPRLAQLRREHGRSRTAPAPALRLRRTGRRPPPGGDPPGCRGDPCASWAAWRPAEAPGPAALHRSWPGSAGVHLHRVALAEGLRCAGRAPALDLALELACLALRLGAAVLRRVLGVVQGLA